ncbi:serine hydrolase domain-containing protein [Nocardia mangyaensis]|uniref:serine hydrolase domain-containing protein n=1 Tax=Nocardia mangyaensis TaxID=2213200 RepID=UPI0026771449|nr:serine hydrolase domain-containing protein [Nocardia mangyaensis]MDO3648592.1 serine hydrolase domain-containing protein [Nocardia mangyaensis]
MLSHTAVRGSAAPRFQDAVDRFGRLFEGGRGGGALAVYLHGRRVVDVWTGCADAAGEVAWGENTGALSYSTSKGVTSTVLHVLAGRGLVDYRAPVAEYWPEFGAKGKAGITVAEAMSHRAGLSRIGVFARNADELADHQLIEERLAAAAPDRFRGFPAYHAISYGTLIAGIARAVTGKSMGELYRTELAEPLGIDGLHLGTPGPGSTTTVARTHGSTTPLGIPQADMMIRLAARTPVPGAGFLRSIYTEGIDRLALGTEPAILRGEMPGANGVFTARSLAAVYNTIATESPLLSRGRVRAMARLQSVLPDRNLLLPMGWRLGYHSWPVMGAPNAFGHIGFAGSGGWVDPASGLAVGFVHNWAPEALSLPRDQFVLLGLLTAVVRGAGAEAGDPVELPVAV